MGKRRYIVHVDMDAFFAAIEQRDDPRYRAKPVIVGALPKDGKGRGVVSTCSYEARRFGIHSAMPIREAYRKCPQGIFLPVNMEKYEEVSRRIHGLLYSFTPDIEPVGIDEAFLDITGSYHLFGTALQTCLSIKKSIKEKTGLTASCGLAPTMMAAKIASDLKKPDGMVEVEDEGLLGFLWPLDVRKLWGLGPKLESALNNMGIKTIGDLAKRDVRDIESLLGKNGRHLWELSNGIDERTVETSSEAKSFSGETTFERDTSD
jgi:DNA polymerase IV